MILARFARITCPMLLAVPMLTSFSFADVIDGDDIFRARCAPCHGKQATGKRSKAPSLVSDKVKSMSDENIANLVASRANGEMERKSAHSSLKKRLTKDQIKAVVAHIRELQKAK